MPALGSPFLLTFAWLPHLQQSSKPDTRNSVSDPLPSNNPCASTADQFLETAPPSGNAIANLFSALRRRRNPAYLRPDQTEVAIQSSAQEDGSATPSKDEAIIADAKSALRACLVL